MPQNGGIGTFVRALVYLLDWSLSLEHWNHTLVSMLEWSTESDLVVYSTLEGTVLSLCVCMSVRLLCTYQCQSPPPPIGDRWGN